MGPKHWLREQEFQKTHSHTSRAKPFYRKLNSMRCGNNFSSDVYKFLKCGTGRHKLHVDAMWHILSPSLCAHVCLTEDTFCARGTRVNHFITKTLSKVVWSCKSQHHCFIFCTFLRVSSSSSSSFMGYCQLQWLPKSCGFFLHILFDVSCFITTFLELFSPREQAKIKRGQQNTEQNKR